MLNEKNGILKLGIDNEKWQTDYERLQVISYGLVEATRSSKKVLFPTVYQAD